MITRLLTNCYTLTVTKAVIPTLLQRLLNPQSHTVTKLLNHTVTKAFISTLLQRLLYLHCYKSCYTNTVTNSVISTLLQKLIYPHCNKSCHSHSATKIHKEWHKLRANIRGIFLEYSHPLCGLVTVKGEKEGRRCI